MQLANTSPAVVKLPPAYKLLSTTTSANTALSIPEPSALQLLPFHLPLLLASPPPASSNPPPAYRSLPDIASAYTTGENVPPIPDPSALQRLPFHLATQLTTM